YVLFYNGEIYNREELRQNLKKYAFKWRTTGDTEILLNGYIALGEEILHHLRGMFAFVVIDQHTNKAFIARDQLGIKPLYYMERQDCIYFASEIKAFQYVDRFSLNEDTIYEQIKFRYVAGKNTIYKDIYRLDAGEFCRIEKGKIRFKHYYHLKHSFFQKSDLDPQKIKQIVKQSIHAHILSDVGYMIQLSGGVDSGYISAVLANDFDQSPSCVSAGIDEKTFDESAYQDIVVKQFNLNHQRYVYGAKDLAQNIEKFTYYMDMPVVHTGCFFLNLLCQKISANHKVILTGEGADEAFGGYQWMDLPKKYLLAKKLCQMGVGSNWIPPFSSKLKTLKKMMDTPIIEMGQLALDHDVVAQLIPDASQNLKYRHDLMDERLSLIDNHFYHIQKTYLQSLLERQDRVSMACGVEVRVPFCNIDIFEMMNGVPAFQKIVDHRLKAVLKNLALEYFKPRFTDRRKIGLTLPLDDWLSKGAPLTDFFDLLTDQNFKQRGLFNAGYVSQKIDRHLKGQEKNGKLLMNLINFECWYRCFIKGYGLTSPSSS
ncbi:MAG: asparagine synthase (glutamine-hydrolyzing), partial [Pseudomonadota bacterium]